MNTSNGTSSANASPASRTDQLAIGGGGGAGFGCGGCGGCGGGEASASSAQDRIRYIARRAPRLADALAPGPATPIRGTCANGARQRAPAPDRPARGGGCLRRGQELGLQSRGPARAPRGARRSEREDDQLRRWTGGRTYARLGVKAALRTQYLGLAFSAPGCLER